MRQKKYARIIVNGCIMKLLRIKYINELMMALPRIPISPFLAIKSNTLLKFSQPTHSVVLKNGFFRWKASGRELALIYT